MGRRIDPLLWNTLVVCRACRWFALFRVAVAEFGVASFGPCPAPRGLPWR